MLRTFLAAVAVTAPHGVAVAQVVHTPVAVTGTAAPGGGNYTGFNTRGPSVNAAGQLAFFAGTSGGGSGVFRYTTTAGTAVVRSGDTAPTSGFTFTGFELSNVTAPAINPTGDVAFYANVTDGTDDLIGVFRYSGGTGVTTALQGQPAPGGGNYSDEMSSGDVQISNAGVVSFYATLTNSANDSGIFRVTGTTGVAVARNGTAAPGGGIYDGLGSPAISPNGLVTFNAVLAGGAEGLFRSDGTATTAIVRTGQAAPNGATYTTFQGHPPQANADGQIAFTASLTGPNPQGVFRFSGGTTATIALRGTQAPGTTLSYGQIASTPQINAAGHVAFHAFLGSGTTDQGVFLWDGSTTRAVALTGMTAPGTTATFLELSFDSVKLSDAGVVAFRGQLTGVGVTTANDRGLWAGTSMDDLTLVAREGDTFVVNGANRVLAEPSAFFAVNDGGIAWRAVFTDGTQAVMYSAVTPVPEPVSVLGLSAIAVGTAAVVRRRFASPCKLGGGPPGRWWSGPPTR
jgi:hypothetical protein